MKKLWRELQYFIGQVRSGYKRQFEEEQFFNMIQPFLSLELAPYSYLDCLAAVTGTGIPWNWHGRIASMLYTRCNRGKNTLDVVTKLLKEKMSWKNRF